MRNIFDQYQQPENRLTHALVTTLDQDRRLLRPFLSWLGLDHIPPMARLRIVEQQVPGDQRLGGDEEDETRRLPDACVFDNYGWGAFFECKVQSKVHVGQLRGHHTTAARHGFEQAQLVVIAVEPMLKRELPERTRATRWQDVYCWFSRRSAKSDWARRLTEYMRVFEAKMTAHDYQIRGTITVFDGIRFDENNSYSSREGKRLIRLLADGLQARKELHELGVDPEGKRRPAITGRGNDAVWDFLPFKVAHHAKQFTDYPHLTILVDAHMAKAAVTIPNNYRGGLKTRLRELGPDGFRDLLSRLEGNLQPILSKSKDAKPMIYLSQRHYKSRKSPSERDAHLEADLRTLVAANKSGVKYQPQWIDAFYSILVNKRSNQQIGIEVRFSFECPLLRSSRAVDLFVQTWISLSPFIRYVLPDE